MASWKKWRMTIFLYESVWHAYSHVTTPLIPCGPPLVARRARTQRGLLSTRVLTLFGRTTPHAWHSGKQGGSMSRSQTPVWSQTCSMRFMSGLWAGQTLTSTPCCARKAIVSRAAWGVALSWRYTKLSPKTTVVQGSILSWGSLM